MRGTHSYIVLLKELPNNISYPYFRNFTIKIFCNKSCMLSPIPFSQRREWKERNLKQKHCFMQLLIIVIVFCFIHIYLFRKAITQN